MTTAAATATMLIAQQDCLFDSDNGDNLPTTSNDFWMYLQLKSSPTSVNKCLTRLDSHMQDHQDAHVDIVGLGLDHGSIRILLGVNLGPADMIKTRPVCTVAAYEFVRTLSDSLANFWPQYLQGTPEDDEQDLLASVLSHADKAVDGTPAAKLATALAQARQLAPTADPTLVTPTQSIVAIDGDLWEVTVDQEAAVTF